MPLFGILPVKLRVRADLPSLFQLEGLKILAVQGCNARYVVLVREGELK
jgi:hypothetical protein